ncbi:MAG: homoserine kinase [Pseudomonadota bacterium]|nr:homoserine kinase [Pseudomonadota bacterium]
MAVYTPVAPDELAAFLDHYDLGALTGCQGISDGIENTNYFVTTSRGRYVLTLFESIGYADLPYYLELMAFLAEHGVPSAHPLADRGGGYLRTLKNRPAALVQRLDGASVDDPDLEHCRAIGAALAHLHRQGRHFTGRRANTRGPRWWRQTADQVLPHLDAGRASLLRDELDHQSRHRNAGLPRGVIHADLFRDNALFTGHRLTGIIDFYYACNDVLLFDLAVTVNDWCRQPDGSLMADKALAILNEYHRQRPLQKHEGTFWPVLLRAAALRFWLSRLKDQLFPRPGELTRIKDPGEFERILRWHRERGGDGMAGWV